MSWYISQGTLATRQKMDPEITLKTYNTVYTQVKKYNRFVSNLVNTTYEGVPFAWQKIYVQIQGIDSYLQAKGLVAKSDSDFSTDLFTQARDVLRDKVNNLNE